MLGHRGAYYLALTDLDGAVLRICLTLLEGIAVFLKKMPEITCAEPELERQEQIAELKRGFDLLTGALADLEIIFPLHWNGIVIHVLLHQLEDVLRFGRFEAVNILVIERFHVKLKAMIKGGTVNPSRTLANKMSAFHDAEHHRLSTSSKEGGRTNKRLSSIVSKVDAAIAERKTEATPIGKGIWVKLLPRQFQLLLETWARAIGPDFDVQILDKFKAYIRQPAQKKQRTLAGNRPVEWWTAEKWKEWFGRACEQRGVGARWAPWQLRFEDISDHVQTFKMATVGSAYFCTVAHSAKRKYDNSTIEQLFEHEDDGRRDSCFGRIQDIFVHSMPWSNEAGKELSGYSQRVVIDADWYVPVGPYVPVGRSGLRQVVFDESWSNSSRMGFLINMYAHNISLWPANGIAADSERDTLFEVVRYNYFDSEE